MSNAKAGRIAQRRFGWKMRVQKVYTSLEELQSYDRIYNIAERCGYSSAELLWQENPVLRGGADPADLGLAKQPRRMIVL